MRARALPGQILSSGTAPHIVFEGHLALGIAWIPLELDHVMSAAPLRTSEQHIAKLWLNLPPPDRAHLVAWNADPWFQRMNLSEEPRPKDRGPYKTRLSAAFVARSSVCIGGDCREFFLSHCSYFHLEIST